MALTSRTCAQNLESLLYNHNHMPKHSTPQQPYLSSNAARVGYSLASILADPIDDAGSHHARPTHESPSFRSSIQSTNSTNSNSIHDPTINFDYSSQSSSSSGLSSPASQSSPKPSSLASAAAASAVASTLLPTASGCGRPSAWQQSLLRVFEESISKQSSILVQMSSSSSLDEPHSQFIFPSVTRQLLFAATDDCSGSFNGQSLQPVTIRINATIPRGLRTEGSYGLAYRRNYLSFMTSVSFEVPSAAPNNFGKPESQDNINHFTTLERLDGSSSIVRIKWFGIGIQAEDDKGSPVELIQHTSKRDFGPRRSPVLTAINPTYRFSPVPATVLAHNVRPDPQGIYSSSIPRSSPHSSQYSNSPSGLAMVPSYPGCRSVGYATPPPSTLDMSHYSSSACLANRQVQVKQEYDDESDEADAQDDFQSVEYQENSALDVTDVVVFDRIQFKRATANNGRKNTIQQLFRISTILYGAADEEDCLECTSVGTVSNGRGIRYIELQRISTGGILVRGRSPGHYTDRRLDMI
ncbi:PhoG like DNA-binding family-domain-containing protein [Lipomyces oligophaga]|uniref:PhoG like DNA-binding family-domain-containing protein n=1 Tax=Lipomyces oligophaga TaxID=45792 RepID=UPI0034CD9D72